jgi:hypothetical protein
MEYKLYDERKMNIDKNLLHKIIHKFSKVKNRSGSFTIHNKTIKYNFIGKGGQGIVFSLEFDKTTIAIKKTVVEQNEKQLLTLMSGFVDSHISPHFLLVYDIIPVYNKDYIVMEKIDGNLNKWLKNNHSDEEWMSFLFQFLIADYVMKNYAKVYHSDLKPKNIFYKNITDENSYLEYRLGNKIYYIPLFNKLFILGDFGHAQSLLSDSNEMSNVEIKKHLQDNSDLQYIHTLIKRMIVDSIIKNYNINDLINIFKQYNVDYLDYYNKEKEKINKDLMMYGQSIKDSMLLKSLAYYIIEKGLTDKLTLKRASEFILPSLKIQKFIENNFDGQKNPERIILENYGKYTINNKKVIGTYVLA